MSWKYGEPSYTPSPHLQFPLLGVSCIGTFLVHWYNLWASTDTWLVTKSNSLHRVRPLSWTGNQLEVLSSVSYAKLLGHSMECCSSAGTQEPGPAALGTPRMFWGGNTDCTPGSLLGVDFLQCSRARVAQDLLQDRARTVSSWLVGLVTI